MRSTGGRGELTPSLKVTGSGPPASAGWESFSGPPASLTELQSRTVSTSTLTTDTPGATTTVTSGSSLSVREGQTFIHRQTLIQSKIFSGVNQVKPVPSVEDTQHLHLHYTDNLPHTDNLNQKDLNHTKNLHHSAQLHHEL